MTKKGVHKSNFVLQESDRRVKMQNMVRFPLMGMDMAPHVVKRSQSSWSLPSHWSPWRRSYGLGRNPDDFLYDLYAVCNHHGNMHGGHYTGRLTTAAIKSLCVDIRILMNVFVDLPLCSQLTAKTLLMVSGTALMTVRFHQWLMIMFVSRQPIYCSIKGELLFPHGRPTALLLVMIFFI